MKGKEFVQHVVTHGGKVLRQNGSHVIVKLPDGNTAVCPDHGHKDLGKGLAAKLMKMAAVAGIPLTLWFFWPLLMKVAGIV